MDNSIEKYMSPELVDKIKNDPESAVLVKKWIEITLQHHNNPVYKDARENFINTQKHQIDKGAAKYPEPLNPDSWNIDELVDHAMMEAVDMVHYITAIKTKSARLAANLKRALELMGPTKGYDETTARDIIQEVIRQL